MQLLRHPHAKTLIVAATILVPLAVIIFIFLAHSSVVEQREASQWVRHTLEVIARARKLNESLAEMQAGVGGYILYQDVGILHAGEQAHDRFHAVLRELEDVVRDNPAQGVRLKSLASAVEDWRNQTARRALEAMGAVFSNAGRVGFLCDWTPRLTIAGEAGLSRSRTYDLEGGTPVGAN
jgi:CHASE3 domain sensor protein